MSSPACRHYRFSGKTNNKPTAVRFGNNSSRYINIVAPAFKTVVKTSSSTKSKPSFVPLSPFWADEAALHDIGRMIHEESRWYLQRCRGKEPRNTFERLEEEHRLQRAIDIAKSYSKYVCLRR